MYFMKVRRISDFGVDFDLNDRFIVVKYLALKLAIYENISCGRGSVYFKSRHNDFVLAWHLSEEFILKNQTHELYWHSICRMYFQFHHE